jgi:iron complex transport system ATP-binding protein
MAGEALLTISNLDVRLGARAILKGVHTEFREGELVVVIGPNGAGKTTFLRALCGLAPSTGAMTFGGHDGRALSAIKRSRALAYLEQRGSIAWPLPVREIVALGRLPFGANHADQKAIALALKKCGLDTFAERTATELSGGELARVLLARALASDAKMLLLDEPVASLDPAWQLEIMKLLKEESRAGRCVVAVLHDLSLAMRYADRILLFASGELAADASPQKLLGGGDLERAFDVRIEIAHMRGGLIIGASLPAEGEAE